MGGEISVIDKGLGERGACFRFNVFLRPAAAADEDRVPADLPSSSASASELQRGRHKAAQPGSGAARGLKPEATHGVLLIQGGETRRILGRWLEGLGVRVWIVDHWELLIPTLEKIRQRPSLGHSSVSERSHPAAAAAAAAAPGVESDASAADDANGIREFFRTEGRPDPPPPLRAPMHDPRTKMMSFPSAHILIIVDMGFELCRNPHLSLNRLLKNIDHGECRVVWLANSNTPAAEMAVLKNKQVPCDLLLHKPLHGSRLQAILDLLQGFGEPMEVVSERNEDAILPEVGRAVSPIHASDQTGFFARFPQASLSLAREATQIIAPSAGTGRCLG